MTQRAMGQTDVARHVSDSCMEPSFLEVRCQSQGGQVPITGGSGAYNRGVRCPLQGGQVPIIGGSGVITGGSDAQYRGVNGIL
jgi:hypothetical protein